MNDDIQTTSSPYVGPRPFERRHQTTFFGRSREVRDLLSMVTINRISLLYAPSGAGKTTLLRALTGMPRPVQGSIELFGSGVGTLRGAERARTLAVVPQELQVPVAFSVEELVMIGRTASMSRLSGPSAKDRETAERAMIYADVIDLRNASVLELSGGEKQRAVIAMALAQEPSGSRPALKTPVKSASGSSHSSTG